MVPLCDRSWKLDVEGWWLLFRHTTCCDIPTLSGFDGEDTTTKYDQVSKVSSLTVLKFNQARRTDHAETDLIGESRCRLRTRFVAVFSFIFSGIRCCFYAEFYWNMLLFWFWILLEHFAVFMLNFIAPCWCFFMFNFIAAACCCFLLNFIATCCCFYRLKTSPITLLRKTYKEKKRRTRLHQITNRSLVHCPWRT